MKIPPIVQLSGKDIRETDFIVLKGDKFFWQLLHKTERNYFVKGDKNAILRATVFGSIPGSALVFAYLALYEGYVHLHIHNVGNVLCNRIYKRFRDAENKVFEVFKDSGATLLYDMFPNSVASKKLDINENIIYEYDNPITGRQRKPKSLAKRRRTPPRRLSKNPKSLARRF